MSCCGPSGEGASKNSEINRILREDRKRMDNEFKLLLLGAGESGKSTIAKQMKIIHKEGFTDEEKKSYKTIIYNNTISSMKTLINAAKENGWKIKNTEAADRVNSIGDDYFSGPLTSELAADIKALWADPGIKEAFNNSSKFQLIDSAQYYFDNIDRIGKSDYVPEEQDVLRSRSKTTGIIEIEFEVDKCIFKVVDVGGQRSERKKWMHCFQDVTAVIFCVALSEYDLKLQEDETTNRMHESVKLFKEICNSQWFTSTNMILFLNKKDLFEEKIKKVDLNVCFPEYKGGKDYKVASQYIQEKFLAQKENPKKVVYPKITCATDTDNITLVFNAVKDIILRDRLDKAGLL